MMIVTSISLENWKNFRSAKDVHLQQRTFIIGPNAAGKSNLLDVFRFLRDLAKQEGGGLQRAIKERKGVSKIRSLSARNNPGVSISVSLSSESDGNGTEWRYELGFQQENRGARRILIKHERVWKDNEKILDRPDADDDVDNDRLTQTALEQINANRDFRPVVHFFQTTTYLHLVPQLLKHAEGLQGRTIEDDPFGQGFLENIATTPEKTRNSRLLKILNALKIAVPQLGNLKFAQDEITGRPHLEALYQHWRPNAGWQREDQFSDGTLRLLGLLWALLDGDSLLLLEEPELSLNSAIVEKLAPLISRTQRKRQILISTHSVDLLSNAGIDPSEVLMLEPSVEGTEVVSANSKKDLLELVKSGMTIGEAAIPLTRPGNIEQLKLFES
jgi:predicted ATPase